MTDLLTYFKAQQDSMIDLLVQMVNHESFTASKSHVDALGAFLETEFRQMGADSITRYERDEVGDILLAKWNENTPGKPILFLVHIDTVWPIGTLADRPPTIDDDGRLFGPGAIDMKGGVAIAMTAISGLRETGQMPDRPVWLLMTTDEEIGSDHSHDIILATARQCGLVLVMEPATREGAIKSWRKGIASYTVSVTGRASHAGNAPEQGINAIIELAQQALAINRMNDLKYGTSVSVTMVSGGSAGNVIPAHAEAYVDTRMMDLKAMERVHNQLMSLQPLTPGAELTVERIHHRPPMERQPAVVDQAIAIGKALGVTVRDDGSGGGSDGSLTAAAGIPTLDGLGAHGDGLHALHEHVLINRLPHCATLAAGIVRDWQFDD